MVVQRTKADVFHAVADGTRRRILDMLRDEKEHFAGKLAEPFSFSQPALSQHLRVLREAGLVRERREGRHRLYRLNPEGLIAIQRWLSQYGRFWDEKLAALGKHLEKRR